MGKLKRGALDRLIRLGRIGLDSMIMIYHVEDHDAYTPLTVPLLELLEAGRMTAVTSEITRLEILAQPFRAGRQDLIVQYKAVLDHYPHLSLIPLDSGVAEEAARLRARYDLRTPDAMQLASAIKGGARGYVTNDHAHRRVAELEVLVLDDMLLDCKT